MKQVLLEMEKLKNPHSGLGQFCMNLGEELQKSETSDLGIDLYLPSNLKGAFGEQFNYVTHTALHKLLPPSSKKYDIWHCLQQDSHYLPSDKSTKLILTIHDLNFLEKYKGAKQKRKLNSLQKRVNRATAITVISKFTELMVRENLELGDTPVHVIYNGNSLKTSENNSAPHLSKYGDYFFSIGIISAKKNFHVLLALLQHFKTMNLVIAGNNDGGYAKQLSSLAQQSGIGGRLHLIGTVEEEEKYHLYKNCEAFVFPSLTEGFGLPVVEAMSLGKPVFLSRLTSLPEVGGPEAYYWPSFESQQIIETVEKGLADFKNDPQKTERIMAWSKQFSWKNAINSYLDLYRTI
jgi:glycosyltransferase involved in cell wall biosynthesis